VIFSYYNPLLNYGLERLAQDAVNAGFDGVLASICRSGIGYVRSAMQGAGPIRYSWLRRPVRQTHEEDRETSTGFVYAVSRTGVTGEQQLADDLKRFLQRLRSLTKLPIAVGFGVSRPEHVQAITDAAVVGSSIVKEIEKQIGERSLHSVANSPVG
jgi:tryptophan synthase alpha chain